MTHKYNLTPETARYFEALRLIIEARDKAYESLENIYGDEQANKLVEPFSSALETASDELFKLVRLNAEINLSQRDSYTEEGVAV